MKNVKSRLGDEFCFSHAENYLGNNFLAYLVSYIESLLQALVVLLHIHEPQAICTCPQHDADSSNEKLMARGVATRCFA